MNRRAFEQSIDDLVARGDELIDVFYFRLLVRAPELVRLLLREDPKRIRATILDSLTLIRHSSPAFDSSIPRFRTLGALLHDNGVEPKHYPVAGDVLIASIADVLGDAWRSELEDAWRDVVVVVAGAMVDGAKEELLRAAA